MNTITNRITRAVAVLTPLVIASLLAGPVTPAFGVIYGGVDFPMGAISFADAVAAYNPVIEIDPADGTLVPDARWRVPADALGIPNYTPPTGPLHNEGQFVSLGNGGSLTVRFTDNALTGSGDAGLDLWIFEVGPEVEAMAVEISTNGTTWHSVGSIGGATAGVDIDAHGFGVSDLFYYVRLTDDVNQSPASDQYDFWSGADIDAVGAISTIPEPASLLLLSLGLPLLVARRRRMR